MNLQSSYYSDEMAEVLAEHIEWRREDIRHTTLQIVLFYTQHLPQFGTSRWANFACRIIPAVMGEPNPCDVTLSGDAFELIFHPPRPTLVPHIKDGAVIWEEKEPRLTFLDSTFMNLSPTYRNLIYRINQAIAEEVSDIYKMTVLKDPLSFVFPKLEYGKVDLAKALDLRTLKVGGGDKRY